MEPVNKTRIFELTHLARQPVAPLPVISIGDSHSLKYTCNGLVVGNETIIRFLSAYISGFSSLSLARRSSHHGLDNLISRALNKAKKKLRITATPNTSNIESSGHSGYILKLLQSLGALSFDNKGLSQAETAQDAAIAYAKKTPLISPLVLICCGDIDLRTKIMRTRMDGSNLKATIETTFQNLLEFLADLKAKQVNIVLEGLTPPTHDDSVFLLHNKYLLPPEYRGKIYLECNSYLLRKCRELGVKYLDFSEKFSNPIGCLREEYEYDGVHLSPSAVEIIADDLVALFQHSHVNSIRYKVLLEKRSTAFITASQAFAKNSSARSIFQEKSILVRTEHGPDVHQLLTEICSHLDFTKSVANDHYRLDWAGNERMAFSEHIRYSPVSQAHLDTFHQLIFGTDLLGFIGNALGFDPCIYSYRPLRSLVHNQEGVGPQSYHYDGCPPGIYRMLIYLTDVDTDSGPFRYMLPSGYVEEVPGCFGTAILFDANKLWHSAKPPLKRERRALDICIGPRHEGSEQFAIAPGMNNWPCDPFHFSVNNMTVSPRINQSLLTFSPFPVRQRTSMSSLPDT